MFPNGEIEPRPPCAYALLISDHLIDTDHPVQVHRQLVAQAIALLTDNADQLVGTGQ